MVKSNQKTKDVVAGLGEIGIPMMKLFSKTTNAIGYDINPNLINKKSTKKFDKLKTRFLHICIPLMTILKKMYQAFLKGLTHKEL